MDQGLQADRGDLWQEFLTLNGLTMQQKPILLTAEIKQALETKPGMDFCVEFRFSK